MKPMNENEATKKRLHETKTGSHCKGETTAPPTKAGAITGGKVTVAH